MSTVSNKIIQAAAGNNNGDLAETYRYYRLTSFDDINRTSTGYLELFWLYAEPDASNRYVLDVNQGHILASYYYSSTYHPEKANQDNTSGWWPLGHNAAEYFADWIRVDLGSEVVVKSFRIRWNSYYWADSCVLQGSNDDSNWTTVHTLSGMSAGSTYTVNLL